jgi:biopolymer transport protein ExbB/TolQ
VGRQLKDFMFRFEALPAIDRYMASDRYLRLMRTMTMIMIMIMMTTMMMMMMMILMMMMMMIVLLLMMIMMMMVVGRQLKDFMFRFEALPAIDRYMASDRYLRRPVYNKHSSFK